MAKLRSTDLNGNLFVSGQLKLQNPFLISTDKLITNLNADKLDGQDGSYYLDYNNFTHTPTILTQEDIQTAIDSIPYAGCEDIIEGLTGRTKVEWNALNAGEYGSNSTYNGATLPPVMLESNSGFWNSSSGTPLDVSFHFAKKEKMATLEVNCPPYGGVKPTMTVYYAQEGDTGLTLYKEIATISTNTKKIYEFNEEGISADYWVIRFTASGWIDLRLCKPGGPFTAGLYNIVCHQQIMDKLNEYQPVINGKVNKSGDTMTGNLSPATNKGASLGTSSLFWNNIYGTTLYENGTSLVDKYADKSHTHTKSQITDFSHTHSKSEVGLGNVDNTADANKSVKYAKSAGTANSVPEANLTWGGKNFASGYGPIDAAMVPSLGANRLAFVPAAGVTVEYSRDAGSTWTDYGLNDTQKTALFSGPQTSTGAVIGKPSRNSSTKKYENVSVNNRLRVTLKSDVAHVYTALNKFVIYCSTNGSTGCKCTIQGLTKNNYDAGNNSWTTFADGIDIAGWSGFNVINTSSIITYSNNGSQYIQLRFTFYCGGNSSMETYGGLSIINIYGFGGVGWRTPSNMAKWGQLYSYDAGQNVFFPAKFS